MIPILDRKAATFAKMAAQHYGFDASNRPGAGAAGGLGYAFMQFLAAKNESGAEIVLKECGFNKKLSDALMVITGEGSSDDQTLMGKLPAVVLKHALRNNVPVLLLSGRVNSKEKLLNAGFCDAIAISQGMDYVEAIKPENAMKNLEKSTYNWLYATSTQP